MSLNPFIQIYTFNQNLDCDINPIIPIQPWTVVSLLKTIYPLQTPQGHKRWREEEAWREDKIRIPTEKRKKVWKKTITKQFSSIDNKGPKDRVIYWLMFKTSKHNLCLLVNINQQVQYTVSWIGAIAVPLLKVRSISACYEMLLRQRWEGRTCVFQF